MLSVQFSCAVKNEGVKNPEKLQTSFAGLTDARQAWKVQHPLSNVLLIGFAAILCGGESFEDMERFGESKQTFFAAHLDLRHGIPSHDTFKRVFERLKPAELVGVLQRYAGVPVGAQVCVDGKAMRGGAVHVLNAYAREEGLVLGQLAVAEKSNEITALPELIRALELAGAVVTVDAMGCQKNVAKEISEADADYVLALKGNQGHAYAEIKSYLDDAVARKALAAHEETDKGHGRVEIRRYYQSDRVAWFADAGQWEKLRSVAMVECERHRGEQVTVQRRYYLSSLPVDVPRMAALVRGHWAIENSLHWVLDVTFGEDRNRTAHKTAAQNLGLMRRLALNLCKLESTVKDSMKGKRFRAACNDQYLATLLKISHA